MGCERLREALWRVRPLVHVCGHVHEGRGAERVRWDLDGRGGGNVKFKEAGTERWVDEGEGGKMSLVDLTGRRGRRLDNDGGHPQDGETDRPDGGGDAEGMVMGKVADGEDDEARGDYCYGLRHPKSSVDPDTATGSRPPTRGDDSAASPGAGTIGLGLSPNTNRSPVRSDAAALRGRMGRRETCVVNCAITATNWPHTGGRRFNKPIVVDLDLPVWAWELEQEDEASRAAVRDE